MLLPRFIVKYKLLIAYDGTRYCGWQVQPNATSIQTLIQDALSTALRTKTGLTGSGRTDAGVHASGQCAHFIFDGQVDLEKLKHSLNGLLPPDIRIHALEKTSEDFHARYSAKSKVYRYHLNTDKVESPFSRLYAYHLPYPIDFNLLETAAHHFKGERDFASFSNEAHRGSAARNSIRNLYRLEIHKTINGLILEYEANGFLYKMVRNITGTMLDVARGKLPLDSIPDIFEAKDRRQAGQAAPPHGLFLEKVLYL